MKAQAKHPNFFQKNFRTITGFCNSNKDFLELFNKLTT